MKIYLAGPMRGYEDFNFPAFDLATKELREAGHEVFSPAENDRKKKYDITTGPDVMRNCIHDDLTYIIREADAIALLPGWQASKGVRAELATAEFLDLKILELVPKENNIVKTAATETV
jgi:nucleoside 2-deoxyribosyltransferase